MQDLVLQSMRLKMSDKQIITTARWRVEDSMITNYEYICTGKNE